VHLPTAVHFAKAPISPNIAASQPSAPDLDQLANDRDHPQHVLADLLETWRNRPVQRLKPPPDVFPLGRAGFSFRCRSQADGLSSGRSLALAFVRRNDVGGRFWIDNVRGEPLATDIVGEQAFNGGKAGQVA